MRFDLNQGLESLSRYMTPLLLKVHLNIYTVYINTPSPAPAVPCQGETEGSFLSGSKVGNVNTLSLPQCHGPNPHCGLRPLLLFRATPAVQAVSQHPLCLIMQRIVKRTHIRQGFHKYFPFWKSFPPPPHTHMHLEWFFKKMHGLEQEDLGGGQTHTYPNTFWQMSCQS